MRAIYTVTGEEAARLVAERAATMERVRTWRMPRPTRAGLVATGYVAGYLLVAAGIGLELGLGWGLVIGGVGVIAAGGIVPLVRVVTWGLGVAPLSEWRFDDNADGDGGTHGQP